MLRFKNLLFTLIAISAFSLPASAQRTYLKASGGYNFPMSSELVYQISQTTTYTYNNATSQPIDKNVYEGIPVNFGKGVNGNVGFGYIFQDNVGLELSIGYLNGGKSTVENIKDNKGSASYAGYQESRVTDYYSRLVLIQPALVFTTAKEGINFYSRIGLVAAMGSVYSDLKYSNSDRQSADINLRVYGGVGLGLQGALGTDIKLSEKAGIFLEGTFNNLSYAPTKGELTKYDGNGIDRLPSMDIIEKEFEFIDDYVADGNVTNSSSQPAKQPKQRYGMNSAGLNIGLKYNF